MIAMLASAALICAASLAVGGAIAAACGWGESRGAAAQGRTSGGWSWLSGAIGLATLLAVAAVAARLPGHAVTAAIAITLLTAASLAYLAWSGIGWRGPTGALVPALVAAAAAAIPFLVNDRIGILGVGLVNDDMASHLLITDWVQNRTEPVPNLVDGGYPLGPHSLVAALAEGLSADPVDVFAGLTLAITALGAITALAALRDLPPVLRTIAAVMAALPYLGAAYLAQGAFKEPLQALLLIGFALGIHEFTSRGMASPRALAVRALPLAVIAAGSVFNYSFPGLIWLAATAVGVWLLHGAPVRSLRPALPVVAIVAAVGAVLTIPEWGRILEFSDFRAFERSGSQTLGNLRQSISPLEALGIWPSGEFRVTPSSASVPAIAFYLGALLGAVALGLGLMRVWVERRPELPSAFAAALAIYIGAVIFGTPYTSAKALAIAAPVGMLIALRGVLSSDWLPKKDDSRLLSRLQLSPTTVRLGMTALGVAFVAAAAVSSALALRQGPVSPRVHEKELNEIRKIVEGGRVLFLGRDDFIAWELRGSSVDTPIQNFYNVGQPPSSFELDDGEEKFDFDSVPPGVLDRYRFVLTTSSTYASEPPGNFAEVARTPSYVLWKRRGATANRDTLNEGSAPGLLFNCDQNRELLSKATIAAVWPGTPITAGETDWEPTAEVTPGSPATLTLDLLPGRWDISLAYDSPRPLTIVASGQALGDTDAMLQLPANLDFRGPSPPFPAGRVEVVRPGPVSFEVRIADAPLAGRLLGAEGTAHLRLLGATLVGEILHVSVRKACGRYVDWFRRTD